MALLDRVYEVGLRRRLARSTIACYQSWIEEFLRYCKVGGRWRTPREIGAADVEQYLSHLARDRRVSASTQNQAMCALVFLYGQVLLDELGRATWDVLPRNGQGGPAAFRRCSAPRKSGA